MPTTWHLFPASHAYGFDIFSSFPLTPMDVGFSDAGNDATLRPNIWDCMFSGYILCSVGGPFPTLNAQFSSTHGTLTPVGPVINVPLRPHFPVGDSTAIDELNLITGFYASGVAFDLAGNDETFNGSPGGGTHPMSPSDPPNSITSFATGAVTLFVWLSNVTVTIVEFVFNARAWWTAPPGGTVTEDRYACDGVFDYSAPRGDVLKSLVGSMAGTVIPPGDLWHVFAGAYNPPTAALTDADLRDSIKGDFRISRRDICNGVKGTFIPSFLPTNTTQTQPNAWRWTDFPPYQGNGLKGHPNYIAEDGGQIIWKNARFGFTTSIWMVQRLAKILLQILRFQVTLHLACKLTAFPVQAGDTITFTHARWAALSPAPPTIFFVTQATLIVVNESGVPALGVDLMLRQHDPAIYQFNPPVSPTDQGEYSAYGTLGTM